MNMENLLGQKVIAVIIVSLHLSTPQIHYPHFPSFYTIQQYPILNGYLHLAVGVDFFIGKESNVFAYDHFNCLIYILLQ